MARDGREADLERLRKTKPRNALEARKVKETGEKIMKERSDAWIGSAREAMLNEYKHGRIEDAKYVSDDLIKHNKQGIGRSSFFISLKGIK